jgi:hypothetical protein
VQSRLRGRGAPLALAALVLGAAGVTVLYCLQLAGYFVMPDELGYVQQAHFIGEHLRPVLPSDPEFGSWSQLEPLLIAVPYALFDTTTAFDVAHAVNAVVLASAAIPAYLLMRRLSPWRPAAYLVAGLTVAVPWMTLAGTMLTENAAYPAFLWALLAAHVTITEPRPRHDAYLLAALAVAYAARTQLSLLAAATGVAIVVHEIGWRWRGDRRPVLAGLREGVTAAVRGHLVLVAVTAVALVFVLSSSSGALLGGYAAPTEGQLLPPGTMAQAREILAQVVAGIGVLPFALATAFAVGSLTRPADRHAHAYAALMIPTVVLMALALGSFSVRFTAGVNDRYLFFLAPLLFCGALAFLLERRRWLLPLALGVAAATALVASATLGQRGPSLVSPAAAFHDVLEDLGLGGVPTTAALLGGLAAAALALTRLLSPARRRQAQAFAGLILAFCAVETAYTMQKITEGQKVSQDYLDGRAWLDRAVPGHDRAAVLLANFDADRYQSAARWWDVTFWNLEADRALRFASQDDFIQKTTFELGIDPVTGALTGIDRPWLVVVDADRRLGLPGFRRAGGRFGLSLLRVPPRPAATYALAGTDPAGRVAPGTAATLFVFPPRAPGTVLIRLSGEGAPRSYRYRLASHLGVVPKGREVTVRVPVPRVADGPLRVELSVPGEPATDPAGDPGPRIADIRLP